MVMVGSESDGEACVLSLGACISPDTTCLGPAQYLYRYIYIIMLYIINIQSVGVVEKGVKALCISTATPIKSGIG